MTTTTMRRPYHMIEMNGKETEKERSEMEAASMARKGRNSSLHCRLHQTRERALPPPATRMMKSSLKAHGSADREGRNEWDSAE